MKRVALLFLLCLSMGQTWCQSAPKPVRFDFQSINVAQVLQLIYGEVLASPYVIDPDVLTDARAVSFRYSSEKGDIRVFLKAFLASLGLVVETRNGIDFIARTKLEEKAEPDTESFVYRPLHRDVHYIARLLSPLFKGSFSVNRSAAASQGTKTDKPVPDGSAASLIDQTADALVFSGTDKEVEKLKELLPQVDFALGEVVVRGVVYEVSTSDKDGSAFGLLASLLGGKLSIGIGSTDPIGSFVRFKNASLDGIYSALSQDSRSKVVSSPSLRIRSGDNGTFSVGQDVPVLGSVSYTTNGQAVQSVEYRSSGVIFNILPTVREGGIDLNIDQQLSNFIATTTGVNNSPTLTKRALKTSVGMQDGDLIVLGGLTENKDSKSRDGLSFLPKFMQTTGNETSRSEILLVLQVQRI
ncbi:type II secretion system protein GspD [Rhodoferax sp. WC2427]|uniref:type II secretion system protein GspD n=1 Tax=Rhodoferax sp. WC2427 TaxID=3234144 RepID=UPI003466C14F